MPQIDKISGLIKRIKHREPLLVILSGPSGVGKDAAIDALKKRNGNLCHIITVTTRKKRPNEIDGTHYHFVDKADFQKKIRAGKFLEWAKVYGNYYGVPLDSVKQAIKHNKTAIIKVDVQGTKTIKSIIPEAIYIFLTPSSIRDLNQRLVKRDKTFKKDFNLRLSKAHEEIDYLPLFDYVIENKRNNLDYAVSRIMSILETERCRVKPRKITIN